MRTRDSARLERGRRRSVRTFGADHEPELDCCHPEEAEPLDPRRARDEGAVHFFAIAATLLTGPLLPWSPVFMTILFCDTDTWGGRHGMQRSLLFSFGLAGRRLRSGWRGDRGIGVGPYRLSNDFRSSSGAIDFILIGLAGMPPTTVNGSTSFEATPIEPTIPCSPTFTPLSTVA
jgi:hypothetical protein